MKAGSRIRHMLEYGGIVATMTGVSALPAGAVLGAFRVGAKAAWPWAGRRRRIGEENLRKCLPELSESERAEILQQSLASLSLAIPEFVCQKKLGREPERWAEMEGWEHVEALVESKRGFFMGSGHFGTWGMLWAVPQIIRKPVALIVKRLENPYVDRLVNRLAQDLGCVRVADRGTGAEIVAAVEAGQVAGFFMDQAALPHQGGKVNFFGHPAWTHWVPYYLALKHDIPFVPIFGVRLGPGRSKTVFRPALPAVKTADKMADLARMAEAMNRELEAIIRAHPGMYMWMHDRFKRVREGAGPGMERPLIGRLLKDGWD